MIALFTDFGFAGPYVGQMKVAILEHHPQAQIVDIQHDLPKFRIDAAATLIQANLAYLPKRCVCLCVIDPGVGSAERDPCVVELGECRLVGPANGIFHSAIDAAPGPVKCWRITWRPERLSRSFHGRDLFAPVAAMLDRGVAVEELAEPVPVPKVSLDLSARVVYIDDYGNIITNLKSLDATEILSLAGRDVPHGEVFAAVNKGASFWYINSLGLVEVALNQGHAADYFSLKIGDPITVKS